ncbi:hypothetical protein JPSP13_12160 [Staphylococcus pseudintermedius]
MIVKICDIFTSKTLAKDSIKYDFTILKVKERDANSGNKKVDKNIKIT